MGRRTGCSVTLQAEADWMPWEDGFEMWAGKGRKREWAKGEVEL